MSNPTLAALTLTLALAGALAPAATAARAATVSSDLDALAAMAAEHQHDKPLPTAAATTPPAQPVTGAETTFGTLDGRPLRGFLARPTAGGKTLPGIVVIHEWWGLNDNIRDVTRRLAGEGYAALAVDLYAGAVATTPDAAQKLAGGVAANPTPAATTLHQAVDYLRTAGAPRVGVIGWCFGGGWSLRTAIDLGPGIDAAVMYYGQPEKDPARLEHLSAPLIGFFGADDKSIPPPAVHTMEAALHKAGKNVEVHIYDGAGHAFANPSGTNYRPAAATDAWTRTVAFFKRWLQAP